MGEESVGRGGGADSSAGRMGRTNKGRDKDNKRSEHGE